MPQTAEQPPLPERLPLPGSSPLPGRLPEPERDGGGQRNTQMRPAAPIVRSYRRPEPAGAAGEESPGSSGGATSSGWLLRRWWLWLLPLLACLLPLFFLIGGENDDRDETQPTPARVSGESGAPVRSWNTAPVFGTAAIPTGLAGVGMPELGAGNAPAPPFALVLVTGSRSWAKRERDALVDWVTARQHPSSRIRTVGPRRPAALAEVSKWLAAPRFTKHRKLVISFGTPVPAELTGPNVKRAWIRAKAGAPVPSVSSADPRRRGAFAGAGALKVARTLGLNVTREPGLLKSKEAGR